MFDVEIKLALWQNGEPCDYGPINPQAYNCDSVAQLLESGEYVPQWAIYVRQSGTVEFKHVADYTSAAHATAVFNAITGKTIDARSIAHYGITYLMHAGKAPDADDRIMTAMLVWEFMAEQFNGSNMPAAERYENAAKVTEWVARGYARVQCFDPVYPYDMEFVPAFCEGLRFDSHEGTGLPCGSSAEMHGLVVHHILAAKFR